MERQGPVSRVSAWGGERKHTARSRVEWLLPRRCRHRGTPPGGQPWVLREWGLVDFLAACWLYRPGQSGLT